MTFDAESPGSERLTPDAHTRLARTLLDRVVLDDPTDEGAPEAQGPFFVALAQTHALLALAGEVRELVRITKQNGYRTQTTGGGYR